MRFNCGPTKEVRDKQKKQRDREERICLTEWHSYFAWFPVRISEDCCVCFETVERRFPNAGWYRTYVEAFGFGKWENEWKNGNPQYRLKESHETH